MGHTTSWPGMFSCCTSEEVVKARRDSLDTTIQMSYKIPDEGYMSSQISSALMISSSAAVAPGESKSLAICQTATCCSCMEPPMARYHIVVPTGTPCMIL